VRGEWWLERDEEFQTSSAYHSPLTTPPLIKTPMLKKLILSAALIAAGSGAARAAEPLAPELKVGEFHIGCQAWTFNRFTAFEAIEKTKQAGGKIIELFPGQKMSKEDPAGVGPGLNAEQTKKLKDKLAQEGVKAVAFGVTGISKNEDDARKLFAWAKDMDIRVINTESADAIDTIEKMVKEFDIKVGFHDHPRKANDPNYRMWDPFYIRDLVKNRDERIGACADTGHWVRSGLNPVFCLKILQGRIVGSHLKDLHVFEAGGHDVVYGTGVSDIPGILDEFKRQNFTGPISVEYEYKWENNLPDVTQCIEFVKNYKPKTK
jgi:sugar phosphate isomerase/epimerase